MAEVGVKSMTGELLPGENRILNDDDGEEARDGLVDNGSDSLLWEESPDLRGCAGGEGGGGGGVGMGFEAGQHQELSGETMVGGSSFR